MNRPNSQILLARKAVAEINKHTPRYAKLILDGGYDDHIEMRVALKAVELALDELILPEDTKVMLTTGKDGDMVAKSKDGGLTWTYVLYEKHKAEVLDKLNTPSDAGTP